MRGPFPFRFLFHQECRPQWSFLMKDSAVGPCEVSSAGLDFGSMYLHCEGLESSLMKVTWLATSVEMVGFISNVTVMLSDQKLLVSIGISNSFLNALSKRMDIVAAANSKCGIVTYFKGAR